MDHSSTTRDLTPIRSVLQPSALEIGSDAPARRSEQVSAWTVETVEQTDLNAPWEREHIKAMALRRRAGMVRCGDGVAYVIDARLRGSGVTIDLSVPADARRIDPDDVRSWSVREVVTFFGPILDSLTALHDAGIHHGGIGWPALRRRADGRGVVVGFHGADRQPDDVMAIAGLLLEFLPSGSVDGDVVATLLRAADDHASHRPVMSDLVQVLATVRINDETVPATSPPARRGLLTRGPIGASDPICTPQSDPGRAGEARVDPINRLSSPARHRRKSSRGPRLTAVPAMAVVALGSSIATLIGVALFD